MLKNKNMPNIYLPIVEKKMNSNKYLQWFKRF